MLFRIIAAGVALCLASAAGAQDNTEAMLQSARQMRATAEQMKGQLPESDIAEMLRSADEIEAQAKAGLYRGTDAGAAAAQAATDDPATRLVREHGKVDWLMGRPACVGYMWENYRTFRLNSGDRDAERDRLCQAAYAHYASWFLRQRDGETGPDVDRELEAYDAAAREAVAFYGKS